MGGTAGRLVVSAGVLVAVVAAAVAAHYQPFGFDEGCFEPMSCARPEAAAVVRGSWWGIAIAAVVVLAGLVLLGRSLAPPVPRPAGRTLLAAGLAAPGGVVLAVVAGWTVLVALFVSAQAGAVAAGLVGLLQARLVAAALHGRGRPDRGAYVVGLLAGAVATAATGAALLAVLPDAPGNGDVALVVVLNGAVLAAVVLVAGIVSGTGPRRALLVAGGVAVGLIAVLVIAIARIEPPSVPVPVPVPAGSAVPPTDTPAPVPVLPVPVPAPPASVPASVACGPDDLTWTTGPVDGAMGLRAMGVVARNSGPAACWLDGVAQVRVGQGGRPLALTVRSGDLGEPTHATTVVRVGVAPGGAAQFALTWRTWGGLADAVTPQAVTVALVPGGPERNVPLTERPAPMDIADGGELYVSGWTPAAR